ncbi:hypothetical protein B0H17DRAFT_1211969 [Mycena rosella]|uniref:Uncharacterized protein n=1 Tax=Mycena rosella TaxID=1033263 RepID=A0AAD7CTN4_MYCRO|nr:hypothetical protein B0H17DRAFT_1211969 [Mycena rosella]
MPPANDANIPNGFILVNGHPHELWSKAAFDHVERLQKDEENRDPDGHDLYIYNDYFGYACCDLVCLTLFMANSMAASVFHTIDDPDLAEAIYNAYGALWMTYILDLEAAAKPQKLGPTHPVTIRNLENVVRTAAKGITEFSDLGFAKDADDLENAMLRVLERNDMDGSAKEKVFLGKSADSDDEGEDEEEETPPSKKSRRTGADDADVRAAAKTWKASAAMKALREVYGPVEHGGRPWDITKWPKAALDKEKARFNLDGDDLF